MIRDLDLELICRKICKFALFLSASFLNSDVYCLYMSCCRQADDKEKHKHRFLEPPFFSQNLFLFVARQRTTKNTQPKP